MNVKGSGMRYPPKDLLGLQMGFQCCFPSASSWADLSLLYLSHKLYFNLRDPKYGVEELCRYSLSVCFVKVDAKHFMSSVQSTREGVKAKAGGGVNMTINYKDLSLPTTLKFLIMTERHN